MTYVVAVLEWLAMVVVVGGLIFVVACLCADWLWPEDR